MIILRVLVVLIQVILGVGLLYHYVLLIAGGRPRQAAQQSEPDIVHRLAIALPAHNEERVIGRTVAHLAASDYPAGFFDIHVVADYCDDGTAAVARSEGAIVHERGEGARGRKGYALGWLFDRLLSDPKGYDAILVFDADSYVTPGFLAAMNRWLARGGRVMQGRHVIINPETSIFSRLADADMRLNNRLRNQAKTNLKLSARLMGDGMCFRRTILESYPWAQAYSLTEDREYGIFVTGRGERVQYAPDAVSMGQAVARWGDAAAQRLRWYGGVFELQKRYVAPLLAAVWRRRDPAALDLALELLLPPFSVLVLASGVLAIATVALSLLGILSLTAFVVSLILVCAGVCYPFLGLAAEHAPAYAFQALLFGPAYAVWRVWIGLRVQVRRGHVPWIRTRRTEEVETTQ